MEVVCCELCGVKLKEGEQCIFATVKRTIEGKEYLFCCTKHADRYEAELKAGKEKSAGKITRTAKSKKSKKRGK